MAGAMRVGLQILRVERHLVDFVVHSEFLEEPDDTAGTGIRGEMQFQHLLSPMAGWTSQVVERSGSSLVRN